MAPHGKVRVVGMLSVCRSPDLPSPARDGGEAAFDHPHEDVSMTSRCFLGSDTSRKTPPHQGVQATCGTLGSVRHRDRRSLRVPRHVLSPRSHHTIRKIPTLDTLGARHNAVTQRVQVLCGYHGGDGDRDVGMRYSRC